MSDKVITIKTTRAQVWSVIEFLGCGYGEDTKGMTAEAIEMVRKKDAIVDPQQDRFMSMSDEDKYEYGKKLMIDLAIEFLRVGDQ